MKPPPCSDTNSIRALTLVELLAVVAVISLLAATVTPALLSSHRAGDLTRSGNVLVDHAALARQSALSRNVIAALVVAEAGSAAAPGESAVVTVLEYERENDSWRQVTPWARLASGVEITDTADTTLQQAAKSMASLDGLRLGGERVTPVTTLVFYPDGHMEGRLNDHSVLPSRRLEVVFKDQENHPNYYGIEFNQNTSHFRVVRPL